MENTLFSRAVACLEHDYRVVHLADPMNGKDIAVLSNLGPDERQVSQRELARKAGISVGLVNAVLKRMVKAGYVLGRAFNRRQLVYCLTKQGIVEISRRSRHYLMRTVREYQAFQQQVYEILHDLYNEGYRYFAIQGSGECSSMLQGGLAKLHGMTLVSCDRASEGGKDHVIINVDESPYRAEDVCVVNLLEAVADRIQEDTSGSLGGQVQFVSKADAVGTGLI